MLPEFFQRPGYWIWKFWRTLSPEIDPELYREARSRLPERWRPALDRMLPPDKAHVLRLYKAISADPALSPEDREALIELALCHDFGKAIVRPTIFERVAKVLFPIPNISHPILGARIVRKLGGRPSLCRRIANHHKPAGNDRLLALFQSYDDRV